MKLAIAIGAGVASSLLAVRFARAAIGGGGGIAPADDPADQPGQTPPFNPEPGIELGRYIRAKIGDGPERCFDTLSGDFVELELCGDLGPFSDALTGTPRLDALEAGAPAGAGMLPLSESLVRRAADTDLGSGVFAPMTSCCG